MTAQQLGTNVMTIRVTSAVTAKRAISRLGAQAGAGTSSAGEAILGFADTNIINGDTGRVVVGVTSMAEAGGAIDGTIPTLKTDAQGRLIVVASGSDIVAAILKPGQVATAAGQIIEVIPILN